MPKGQEQQLLDGGTVENKGKLILTEIFPSENEGKFILKITLLD